MNTDQTQNVHNESEIEIDLFGLLQALKRKLALIILAAILGGAAAGAFSKYVMVPQYSSQVTLFVLTKETTLATLTDLQIGSQLSNDYQVILKSRPVLQEVIEQLNLDMNYKTLRNKLTVSKLKDTRMLEVSVTDPDPELCKQIVDQVAAVAADYIADIMEMTPPKVIEDGEVDREPVKPNNMQNVVLGGIIATLLACVAIAINYLMNDSVQTEEDVAKYLGLSVLASIPAREGRAKQERKQRKEEARAKRERKHARKARVKKRKAEQKARKKQEKWEQR